jgi:hypothetical protein
LPHHVDQLRLQFADTGFDGRLGPRGDPPQSGVRVLWGLPKRRGTRDRGTPAYLRAANPLFRYAPGCMLPRSMQQQDARR